MRTTLPLLALATAASAQNPGDLVWTTPITGECYACPTVGPDGTLYVATHKNGGVLYKLDGSTGVVLAQVQTPGAVEHSVALSDDGLLYLNTLNAPIASGAPPQARMQCYRASDLALVWSQALYHGADNSPMLGRNGRVYTGVVASPQNPSHVDGRFYSFDALTGAVKIDLWVEGWAACPGVVDEAGRVFFGVEDIQGSIGPNNIWPGWFYAISGDDPPSGGAATPAWPKFRSDLGDFGSPCAWAAGIVYTTCRDGLWRGFDAASGAVTFEFDLGAPSWTGTTIGRNPANGRLVLYTGTQNIDIGGSGERTLYAVELDGTLDGNLLWARPFTNGFAFGTGALDDLGFLYVVDSASKLFAVDPQNGDVLWSRLLAGSPLGGVGGPTITEQGLVVAASNGGTLYAFKAYGSHVADDVPWPKYKHDLRNTSNVLTPIRGACELPQAYCTSTANSSGAAASIGCTGSTSVAADDLELFASGCPPLKSAMFFYGATQQSSSFYDGTLCIGAPRYRLGITATDAAGNCFHELDLAAPPQPAGQINAGSSWNFQLWFRDPSGGATGVNLSNGLGASFCP